MVQSLAPASAPASSPGSDLTNDSTDDAPVNTTQPKVVHWDSDAYPQKPDVVQANLGSGGYLTGYFFSEQSLAVLSLPSFDMGGVNAQTFSASVSDFISNATAAGLQHVLIDVQSNGGGDSLLSTELFKT